MVSEERSGRADGVLEQRILDAALTMIARWGVAKTTVADVAKEARCGRATVYRRFPGGKDELFAVLGRREVDRFFAATVAQIDAATDLEDALVAAVTSTSRVAADHDALRFVLRHEPEVVLPYLGFAALDRLFAVAAASVGPHLARFVGLEAGPWAAEWVGRMVLSYLFNPAPGVDLADPNDARALVHRFLVPALAPATRPVAETGTQTHTPPTLVPALQGS